MTTYWKSQDRKFCDFCKCWLADNKVSISFHENGKRHKESLKKHLSDLSKRSAKEFKQNKKLEDDIKKMEKAAMSAYVKDIQNNADLTSQCINEMLELSGNSSKNIVTPTTSTEQKAVWQEMKNKEGKTYFWNIITNETTWDPPDNFISLASQEKNKLKTNKIKEKQKKQQLKECAIEYKAKIARESMRKFEVEPIKTEVFGPMPCGKPFGSWKPVIKKPEKKIDLQLPKNQKEKIPPPVTVEPERIEFKERKVDYSGEGPVEFKKRKFNSKRNVRQKMLFVLAAVLLVAPALAKPQVLYDYGYYAPAYVASYSSPLAYSYPYAYAYSYPLTYSYV